MERLEKPQEMITFIHTFFYWKVLFITVFVLITYEQDKNIVMHSLSYSIMILKWESSTKRNSFYRYSINL